jgi:hypothetical protein
MTLWVLAVSGLLVVLTRACAAQDNSPARNAGERAQLPPNVLQMARIIKVDVDFDELAALAAARKAGSGLSLEELLLRQKISDAVVTASLDVDSVVAEIDYEGGQTVELRSLWRYKRDRAIGSTNLAVLATGTGLGVVSGLLQFSKTTSSAGNAVGFAAGGVSTLFSLRSYRLVHGGKRPGWVLPNMLAAFFGQPEEQHSHYPDDIWAYLNSVPAGAASPATRKEQILAGWAAAGRIGSPGSLQRKRRIALLTSTNAADKDISIESLNERAAMLADVRDQVSLMKRDLADLLRSSSRGDF